MERQERQTLIDEACGWIARLRSDASTNAVKATFSSWINQSEEHLSAFDSAVSTWETTSAIKHSPAAQLILRDYYSNQKNSTKSNWVLSWQPVAFACALVVAIVAVALSPLDATDTSSPQNYATRIGEQKTIALPDGSTIELNTNSKLQVHYTDELRSLSLEQGEAFFKVASNRQRPFVVNVGEGTVTAVGTAFGINRSADKVSVTVVEGIVSVREREVQPQIKPESRLVKADEGIAIDKQGLTKILVSNIKQTLAWRDRLLVLENQPLPSALAELNRYLRTPVDFTDPSLAHLKVSGTFSLQEPESTLTALMTSFNLEQDTSSHKPRLYARP